MNGFQTVLEGLLYFIPETRFTSDRRNGISCLTERFEKMVSGRFLLSCHGSLITLRC